MSSQIPINNITGFEKFGYFELNHSKSKSLIKLIKYKTEKNQKNEKGSHIYLIVVNDLVYKLGCSTTKLSNFAGYGVGNSGQPSDRTTGIHYYIAKELFSKNKVEFYVKMCLKVDNFKITNLLGEEKIQTIEIDPKIIETNDLNAIKNKFNMLPKWNKQEQGRKNDWEITIKNINRSIKENKKIEYQETDANNILMKLYHWKYNNICLT